MFGLVYYSMIAALMWFAILAYALFIRAKTRGGQLMKETFKKQQSVFHLAAWCVPLALTVVCLTIAQVTRASLHATIVFVDSLIVVKCVLVTTQMLAVCQRDVMTTSHSTAFVVAD